MDNVVSLQRWYYPSIFRVVIDKRIFYHACVLESMVEQPEFTIGVISKILKIEAAGDWFTKCRLITWSDATAELNRLVAEVTEKEVSPHGFFITIRPRHNDITVADHPEKIVALSA